MDTPHDGQSCITCELTRRRNAGDAPPWDSIHRAQFWDVAHSFNTSLLGWLVVIARRHIEAVDQMTAPEAAELGDLIRRTSIALKQGTGCARTYVAQFAEAQGHHHVHFHVIPRMPGQPDDLRGPNIFKCLGVPADQRVTEAAMNDLAAKIRQSLSDQ